MLNHSEDFKKNRHFYQKLHHAESSLTYTRNLHGHFLQRASLGDIVTLVTELNQFSEWAIEHYYFTHKKYKIFSQARHDILMLDIVQNTFPSIQQFPSKTSIS